MSGKQSKKTSFLVKFYIIFSGLIIGSIALVFLLLIIYNDELPSIDAIYDIELPLVTTIYASGGEVLQAYHYENRTIVPYAKLPPHVIHALIAAEDANFYRHWGIDYRGFLRAVLRNISSGFGSQGGSTITQQLARMLFINREVSLKRKIKEAFVALKIERTYSKYEIIEMYLNKYYFGNRSYGIETAARRYFNKHARSLNIEEAATLIGVLNAPSRYSPLINPERALARRNYVLRRMVSEGYLAFSLLDSLITLPIELDLSQNVPGEAPYFTEMVRQYLINKYGEKIFYEGGLNVYTSLNLKLQKVVEVAIAEQLDSIQARIERTYTPEHRHYSAYTLEEYDPEGDSVIYRYKEIQAAFVAIDNASGNIIAFVGGKDFSRWKFNRAIQAPRQPGSAFKPFVYAAAVNSGYHTCDILYDTPIVLTIPGSKEWRPHNFDERFEGPMSIRRGLSRSRNLIAIKLLQKIEPQKVIFYAHKMGIESSLSPVPSLAIGTSEVNLLELVSAYTTFPNSGIHIRNSFISKVIDRYGNVLEENRGSNQEVVMTAASAYMMVNLMQSVLDDSTGTGRKARWLGFLRPAAGKTGTSDNFCDNWFVGYTPQITAGCWVGFDDKTSIGKNQTGSANALPIWAKFMIAAHDTLDIKAFSEPEGIIHERICQDSGKLASPYCTNTRAEVFLERFPINEVCPLHRRGGIIKDRNATDTSHTIRRF